ncbi:glycosyl transferase, partial [bacterium F11]
IRTVYHGLPKGLIKPTTSKGAYFAFLGRICPEKRVDRAIKIALEMKTPIKIAAKVDQVDKTYFHDEIEPLLKNTYVEYIGEIGEGEKEDFLSNAIALLFPIDWPEPFGLAMIEAMACGVPVIAYRRGSVPEIIEEGVTGYIVDTFEEAIKAAQKVGSIDRQKCRQKFEEKFTADRMAQDYISTYEKIIRDKEVKKRPNQNFQVTTN